MYQLMIIITPPNILKLCIYTYTLHALKIVTIEVFDD